MPKRVVAQGFCWTSRRKAASVMCIDHCMCMLHRYLVYLLLELCMLRCQNASARADFMQWPLSTLPLRSFTHLWQAILHLVVRTQYYPWCLGWYVDIFTCPCPMFVLSPCTQISRNNVWLAWVLLCSSLTVLVCEQSPLLVWLSCQYSGYICRLMLVESGCSILYGTILFTQLLCFGSPCLSNTPNMVWV